MKRIVPESCELPETLQMSKQNITNTNVLLHTLSLPHLFGSLATFFVVFVLVMFSRFSKVAVVSAIEKGFTLFVISTFEVVSRFEIPCTYGGFSTSDSFSSIDLTSTLSFWYMMMM